MNKLSETYFTIGEFASLFKLSKQTLFYYERNNILRPAYIDENGYRYVMGGRDVDVIAAGKAMNEALDGRGGGSKEMFQGSLKAAREQIEEHFANL